MSMEEVKPRTWRDLPPSAFKPTPYDDFAPYHPSASHVPPDYRDGWNACFAAALEEREAYARSLVAKERERCALMLDEAAQRLLGAKRTNQVDRHVADVLESYASAIRSGTKE